MFKSGAAIDNGNLLRTKSHNIDESAYNIKPNITKGDIRIFVREFILNAKIVPFSPSFRNICPITAKEIEENRKKYFIDLSALKK